jgi:hypothetical protein
MAEKHKSKYKKPENTKYKSRKDLKDYTVDDKDGKLNPYSTKNKLSNVLRKTDKPVQDDGNYDVKYNADDRLYKDLEDGEYDAKHAAKVFKKRQDNEEKNISDVIKDKVENLTREQRERLVREYVRKKIVKVILEQSTPAPEEETEKAPTDAPAPDAAPTDTPPAPTDAAPTDPMAPMDTPPPAAPAPTDAAPAPVDSPPAPVDPAAAPTDTAEKDAESEVSPETKEALDVDRFVQYLKKQEGNIAKLKSIIKVIGLSLNKAEVEDKANVWKMLKITSNKQLAKLNTQSNNK